MQKQDWSRDCRGYQGFKMSPRIGKTENSLCPTHQPVRIYLTGEHDRWPPTLCWNPLSGGDMSTGAAGSVLDSCHHYNVLVFNLNLSFVIHNIDLCSTL